MKPSDRQIKKETYTTSNRIVRRLIRIVDSVRLPGKQTPANLLLAEALSLAIATILFAPLIAVIGTSQCQTAHS